MVAGRGTDGGAGLLAQLRRGVLEYCVMALLRDDDRYAFDLVRELAEMDGMGISEGTIYPLLARLRRDGLVESTWRESPAGPPRRYYRLSTAGRASLRTFIGEWTAFRDAVELVIHKEARDGHG